MSEGVVAGIARAWRDPRGAMSEMIDEGLEEPRALAHLVAACFLLLVASLPNAVREARVVDIEDSLSGVIAAHLFGYMFVLPLVLYGLAALAHLVARAFGGGGGFLAARSALFWTALAGAPIALALALLGVAAEATAGGARLPWLSLPGYAGLAFWIWLYAGALAEAEGFASTGRVAAALAGVFGGLAILSGFLAGGAGG
jgi:hypothetical protein